MEVKSPKASSTVTIKLQIANFKVHIISYIWETGIITRTTAEKLTSWGYSRISFNFWKTYDTFPL
jgi:N6-adenosine-specific RNA methylase IME4